MFRFEYPEFLFLLLILPVYLLIFSFSMLKKKLRLKKFGKMASIRQLMPDVSLKRQYLKHWILLACIALFVLIIARPQFGSRLESVKKRGIEVMVCVDVSNSMLSQDIYPSRLEKAKQILSQMVDGFENDKVGLIVFAGDAYIQLPITSDYTSAKMFLSEINPSMVPTQGTAIGSAINMAMRSFSPSSKGTKTIILLTDGENHEDDAVAAAKQASGSGVEVNVIGVGSPLGGKIPMGNGNYMKDRDGNIVITKLSESMCKEIADAGKGVFIRADNTNSAIINLEDELNKMKKSELENRTYSAYDEKFQFLGWILLIILAGEFFILDRKSKILRKIRLFK